MLECVFRGEKEECGVRNGRRVWECGKEIERMAVREERGGEGVWGVRGSK
jgi:hypothetical protein